MPADALLKRCEAKDWPEAQRLVDRTPGAGGAGADEAAAALCREKDPLGRLPLHNAAYYGAPHCLSLIHI